MIVVPSSVKEYSTAMAFDLVTRLAINPLDSRLRRVLVSIRWETLPSRRRNCPCRYGLCFSENKILGVHLPMKSAAVVFDPGIVFIASCLPRKRPGELTVRIRHSRLSFATRHRPSLPVLACPAQLGTHVYLGVYWFRFANQRAQPPLLGRQDESES